ncbi:hypothetical protein ACCO45_007136 [Purpureocillium lilacinum]|uniref:Uncharacterized protein n=1 Tax=Purpureocillium lilacinum TaxID=33203 RepID=A0ACC4DSW9_PURLI
MEVLDEKQRLASQNASQDPPQTTLPLPRAPLDDDGSEALVTDGFQLPNLDAEPSQEEPPPMARTQTRSTSTSPGSRPVPKSRIRASSCLSHDGRVNININTKNRRLADLLQPTLDSQISPRGEPGKAPPPRLNVVVQIVGSRGDVQPFVALGKVLKDTYGHRVRIATHATFQTFVEDNGLEFFNIGGDPAELMAFMVRYPGLMPGFDAVKSGEVSKRRRGIQEMLLGCWRSCIEAGDGLGPPPKPHPRSEPLDLSQGMPGDQTQEPFVADAIIANPPSFAHIHYAMVSDPGVPHPLANIQSSNADDVMTNYMTYTLVEMMTWQVPYTYCWSPSLISKPNDWGRNIDISGFYFLNLASSYTPDPELAAFLEAGPPPVYIGFGSIVVDDPNAMTRMIFDAIHLAGVRALVSKGWGGLGADDVGLPEGVFMLGNVPHDWLFQHVSCVVHHGGAGTTAAGIKAGKPTLVPFWGAMIARAKAGPDPVAYKDLTAEKLAEAIKFCLRPETLEQAKELGEKIREERGTEVGVGASMPIWTWTRCGVRWHPSRAAAWRVRRTKFRLSPLAAAVLVDEGLLQYSDVKLYRTFEYNTEDQPPDPISAGACSLVGDLTSIGMAVADMPREIFRTRQRASESQSAQSSVLGGSSKQTLATSDTTSRVESNTDTNSIAPMVRAPPSASASSVNLPELPTSPNASQQSLPESSLVTTIDSEQRGSGEGPRARSSSGQLRQTFSRRDSSPMGMSIGAAVGAGRGVGRVVSTGVKSPMNFCLGLAKGFRNMPRLYNDDTIRPIEKVTDLSSGIKIAGKELGYGFFDGIAGMVTQPLRGAEKEGAGGLVKGIGKGIWGVPAYMMQGVHAELNKQFARSVHNYIITSRVVQGRQDLDKATPEERADIVRRWNNSKFDLKNFYILKRKERVAEKAPAESESETASVVSPFSRPKTSWLHTRHMSAEDRKKLQAQKGLLKRGYVDAPVPQPASSSSSTRQSLSDDAEYEQAIRASVQETSHGNAEEDAMIEAAIRESVRVMRQRGGLPETVPELPEKDIGRNPTIFDDEEYQITDEEYQSLIERAIQQSLVNHMSSYTALPQEEGIVELDAVTTNRSAGSGQGAAPYQPTEEEDAELLRAIEESKRQQTPTQPEDDEELKRAIEASKEHLEHEASQRTEEEIVLEYVKKQSLAEEEYRRQIGKGKGKAEENPQGDDEDEELKRALEESLRMHRGDESGPSGSRAHEDMNQEAER